jgi:multiple sugar transport system substrate-binding protein
MRESSRSIRTALAALVALIAMALTVSACGGSDSSSSSSSGGTAKAGKAKAGTKIVYWASNQGATIQQDDEVINKAAAAFKTKTGIVVEHKVIPWSDLFTNITTATTSGKGPDVLNIGNTWSASLQATGAFLPFEGKDLEAIGGKDKFVQTSLSASGAPGKTITSVPLYGLSYGLFYNKKLFKDANLEPPKTWSEFVAAAKKLTVPSKDQWGMVIEGASISEGAHFAFILGRQNGGKLFAGTKPTFDSAPIVKGVTDYVNIVGKDKIANPSNAQYGDGTKSSEQFAKGKTGMLIQQNNGENNLKSNGMKKSEYGIAEVPVEDGSSTPIMTHVAGINISIFSNTKQKDAALQWVKFLTSPEEQVTLNQSFGSLPVVTAAQSNPAFQTANLKTFNGILADHAEPMPLIPEEGQMETFIGTALKGLVAKAATKGAVSDADVKAALKDANDKMVAAAGSG